MKSLHVGSSHSVSPNDHCFCTAFAQFVGSRVPMHSKLSELTEENRKIKVYVHAQVTSMTSYHLSATPPVEPEGEEESGCTGQNSGLC